MEIGHAQRDKALAFGELNHLLRSPNLVPCLALELFPDKLGCLCSCPEHIHAGGMDMETLASCGSVWILPFSSQGCLASERNLGETYFTATIGKVATCCKPPDVPSSAYYLSPSFFLLTCYWFPQTASIAQPTSLLVAPEMPSTLEPTTSYVS